MNTQRTIILLGLSALTVFCGKGRRDLETVSRVTYLASGASVAESTIIHNIDFEDFESTPEKKRHLRLQETYTRDSREYMYQRYFNANLKSQLFSLDDNSNALWTLETDAQYSYVWYRDLRYYYVTVSNSNGMKGAPPVFSTYALISGKLIISNNFGSALEINSDSNHLLGIVGYHAGHSIPLAVTTWQTQAIKKMKYPTGRDYVGILSYGSTDANLQKFAVFVKTPCIRDATLFFNANGRAKPLKEVSLENETGIELILHFEGYEECPTETLSLPFSRAKQRFVPKRNSQSWREFTQ